VTNAAAREAYQLVEADLEVIVAEAASLCDAGHGSIVTFSPKVFIPLTHLCRDVCHYCTFAKSPRQLPKAFLEPDEVLDIVLAGAEAGCTEALFTLGDRPETRYAAARTALAALGHRSTLSYLVEVARRVHEETGLLPHLNPGVMSRDELAELRPVAASMGLMVETTAERLGARGGPHFGSPDKDPQRRLEVLRLAGEAQIPFTTGLLIGIGETRHERIDTLLAIKAVHERYGHIQEVIIQNFRAKAGTRMAAAAEPSFDELRWTVAAARLLLGPEMNIQAPPNLSDPDVLADLILSGINDWGGVSPVTADHVNPERRWPSRERLAKATSRAGKVLVARLPVYPEFARGADRWVHPNLRRAVLCQSDSNGFARDDPWVAGSNIGIGGRVSFKAKPAAHVKDLVHAIEAGESLGEAQIHRLLDSRDGDLDYVLEASDRARQASKGDVVTYVVNRNINYTNICAYRCRFCAFSKGKTAAHLRGSPYLLSLEEVSRRVTEAWEYGATEVCMQGGIHPEFTGATYLGLLEAARRAAPGIHVHAFSPLEVWHGASTLGQKLDDYLGRLKAAGLGSLPGTAAEILHDGVRSELCPDKLSSQQWIDVIRAAHRVGLPTTATMMFGHIERPEHWARHLVLLRDLQSETGGFTEFVPLPFVHMEAPIYLKGGSRKGPTWREVEVVHAVSRLVLGSSITNLQACWVKLGPEGLRRALDFGVNDVGGTLMNESITRSAGAVHGQEMSRERLEAIIRSAGRIPQQRTTLYERVPAHA
jgi:FO synthase